MTTAKDTRPVVLLNYGMGNLASVENAIAACGESVRISNNPDELAEARAYILPGVGAFGEAMKNLNASGLTTVLEREVIGNRKPILGICLGMQLLGESSEENGMHAGLGWLPGKVVQMPDVPGIKLPHVGWNTITMRDLDSPFHRLKGDADFYFDHSFQMQIASSYVVATVQYGAPVVAAVKKDHVCGVQFHPEKSQKNGLRLLKGFFDSLHSHARGG